jgi:acetolactate synthase-1/2/3 large subunit
LQLPRPRRPFVSPDVVADAAPKSRDLLSERIAAALPDGAIIVDESITSVSGLFAASGSAARHTWLDNRGGSIGFALPVAIGAAIAAPDRRVVALCGDGSSMYSVQSLWTIAREKLDITVLVFANRAYSILISELSRATGKSPTERARALLTLDNPAIDWQVLASSVGIASSLARSANDLQTALSSSFSTPGPHLIEILT